MSFQIAIDGPVAAGKSTVARILAKKLDFVYVDTGAMYRAITLLSLRNGIDVRDEDEIVDLLRMTEIDVRSPKGEEVDGRLSTVLLNGEDVSWEIRKTEIGEGASIVSQYPEVRRVLVRLQQEIAKDQSVIMEGRDIGTRVLLEAILHK